LININLPRLLSLLAVRVRPTVQEKPVAVMDAVVSVARRMVCVQHRAMNAKMANVFVSLTAICVSAVIMGVAVHAVRVVAGHPATAYNV